LPPAARTISRRDLALLAVCVALSVAALGLPERIRDPLAATLRRTLLAPLVSLQHDAELTRIAWRSRSAVTLKADSIAMRALALPAAESENVRLRKMLGLTTRIQWGFVSAEVLQGRGVGEDYTVTLSTGSTAGVRPFSPVVAAEGLVGLVKSVDPSMSTAVLWAHPDFRASAMAADGSVFGIVAAHPGADAERFLLEMRGVPMRSTIAAGTLIVTSGLGGTFPRGIPIGVVLSEVKTPELWARTYLLRPAVSPTDLSSVMVLLSERTRAGVDAVWKDARGDSTLRHDSVVAAPDSAMLSAMRLTSDSLAADSARRRRRKFRRDSIAAAAAAESVAVRGAAPDSARAPVRKDSVPPGTP
jgi:rod shape-determining protein MreC